MAPPPGDPTAPPPSSGALLRDPDASLSHEPAPASSSGAVSAVAEAAPPSSGAAQGRIESALRSFLASLEKDEARDFIEEVILERDDGRHQAKMATMGGMSGAPGDAARRVRLALDLSEVTEAMLRKRLGRKHPSASPADLEAMIVAWRSQRPGAEHGDGEGRPVAWPRRP